MATLMRVLFIIGPAVLVGGLIACVIPVVGLVVFALLCGIGISATKPHPERMERR